MDGPAEGGRRPELESPPPPLDTPEPPSKCSAESDAETAVLASPVAAPSDRESVATPLSPESVALEWWLTRSRSSSEMRRLPRSIFGVWQIDETEQWVGRGGSMKKGGYCTKLGRTLEETPKTRAGTLRARVNNESEANMCRNMAGPVVGSIKHSTHPSSYGMK